MITATVRCEFENEPLSVPGGWEWGPEDWSDVLNIKAELLSAKERAVVDARLDDLNDARKALPFVDGEVVEAYARFHRFQPNFQNVAE